MISTMVPLRPNCRRSPLAHRLLLDLWRVDSPNTSQDSRRDRTGCFDAFEEVRTSLGSLNWKRKLESPLTRVIVPGLLLLFWVQSCSPRPTNLQTHFKGWTPLQRNTLMISVWTKSVEVNCGTRLAGRGPNTYLYSDQSDGGTLSLLSLLMFLNVCYIVQVASAWVKTWQITFRI